MSRCEICTRWESLPRLPHLGHCSLELPRWLIEVLPEQVNRTTRNDASCSFHDLTEMEGDSEAIYGWGGQG